MCGQAPAFEVTKYSLRRIRQVTRSSIKCTGCGGYCLSWVIFPSYVPTRPCYYLSFSYFGFSIFVIKYVRHKNRLENNLEKAHVTASQMTHHSPMLMALRSQPLPSFLPLTRCSLLPCALLQHMYEPRQSKCLFEYLKTYNQYFTFCVLR